MNAFRFAEHPVHRALGAWLLTCWEFRVGGGAPAEHHVPPDGCTNLILVNQGTPHEALIALGPFVAPRVVPAHPGMRTTGIRLHPAAGPALLGIDMRNLANQAVPVRSLAASSPNALAGALRKPSLEDAASAVEALLMPAVDRLRLPDPLATKALHRIWQAEGRVPLPAIAGELGCSTSTLLRRVKAANGLTPKQYARIVRFHAAVRGLLHKETPLSHMAAQGGYADQPHFHHEVTALTGLTPSELAERVRQTEHRLLR